MILVLVLFLNACNREQDGDSWGPGHRGLEESGLVRRKKVLLVVFSVVVLLFGRECSVYGEEDGFLEKDLWCLVKEGGFFPGT